MVREATARVRRTDASAKIFTYFYAVGKPGICQLIFVEDLRSRIFDTFPLPYPHLDLTFEGTPYLLYRDLYAVRDGTRTIRRLMSISHTEREYR